MRKLDATTLWSLEQYSKLRPEFRKKVMAHKRQRTVHLGGNLTLLFEDELTIRYQVQEMLRIEKTFEEAGIQAELDAYNPLIPDGRNFKATMLIEYEDPAERKQALERLIGVEDQVWVKVGEHTTAMAIADEDMPRENDTKTSSVHFLRFEIDDAMADALRGGAPLTVGVSHPAYTHSTTIPAESRRSLVSDLA